MSSEQYKIKQGLIVIFSYIKHLSSKWYLFVFFCGLCLGLTYYFINQQPHEYYAQAVFMTADDKGGGLNSMLQLAGQLGLVNNKTEVDSEKIMELLATNRIISSALLESATISGKDDLLFNHYIAIFEPEFEAIESHSFIAKEKGQFDYNDNLAANQIIKEIKEGIINANVSDNGIITATCQCENQEFCIHFLNYLVSAVSDFHVDKSVEKQNETFRIINQRVDSIKADLGLAEHFVSEWYDTNRKAIQSNTLNSKKLMEKVRLERGADILSTAYMESIKNLEIAKMQLLQSTPFIQIIDEPTLPLELVGRNTIKNLIIVGLLSGIFLAIVLLSIKVTREILATEE